MSKKGLFIQYIVHIIICCTMYCIIKIYRVLPHDLFPMFSIDIFITIEYFNIYYLFFLKYIFGFIFVLKGWLLWE